MSFLKIGELSRRTGISVRMLRHYDEIGLCSPGRRSEAGYRLYSGEDVRRLQQVVSLRQLGFSLDDVGRFLASRRISPEGVLEMQIARLDGLIESQRKLRARLARLSEQLRASEDVSPDEFIQLIEATIMYEKYYTPEQLEELKARADSIGPQGMEQAQTDWATLIEEVRAEMARGTDPADERVLSLARRWNALINAFTGGNPEIEKSLNRLWQEQGQELSARHGQSFDPAMAEFMGKARSALSREG